MLQGVSLLGTSTKLENGKIYDAEPATNQPQFLTKKLYFVHDGNGDSVLCTLGEEMNEYYAITA